ncbi:50S ribosomal protein L23 [Candidatus Micrarchaeota archaeon]|nr:50S ribosomal protein L23 [Candidatus Micrarchaeota archaeon]
MADKKTSKEKKQITKTKPASVNDILPNHIKRIIATEKAVTLIEFKNTLIFEVDKKANKHQIKNEVENLYNVKVSNVRIKIMPTNVKHAFVKLTPKYHADELAAKLKVI